MKVIKLVQRWHIRANNRNAQATYVPTSESGGKQAHIYLLARNKNSRNNNSESCIFVEWMVTSFKWIGHLLSILLLCVRVYGTARQWYWAINQYIEDRYFSFRFRCDNIKNTNNNSNAIFCFVLFHPFHSAPLHSIPLSYLPCQCVHFSFPFIPLTIRRRPFINPLATT